MAVGVAGLALTTTLVVPAADVQPFTVTVTEYVPAIVTVAFRMDGFCRADVKLFGPVHAYVAPVTAGVLSAIVPPSQYGPPLDAVGVAGSCVTVTVVAADGALEHPALATPTV